MATIIVMGMMSVIVIVFCDGVVLVGMSVSLSMRMGMGVSVSMTVSVMVMVVIVSVIVIVLMMLVVFCSIGLFGQLFLPLDDDRDLARSLSRPSAWSRPDRFGTPLVAIPRQVEDRLVLQVVPDTDGQVGDHDAHLRARGLYAARPI